MKSQVTVEQWSQKRVHVYTLGSVPTLWNSGFALSLKALVPFSYIINCLIFHVQQWDSRQFHQPSSFSLLHSVSASPLSYSRALLELFLLLDICLFLVFVVSAVWVGGGEGGKRWDLLIGSLADFTCQLFLLFYLYCPSPIIRKLFPTIHCLFFFLIYKFLFVFSPTISSRTFSQVN